MLVGIPVARLADRANRRNIVAGAVFIWSIATALCGLARSFGTLFVARIGVGAGEGCLGAAAYSILADYFPKERLARNRMPPSISAGYMLMVNLIGAVGGPFAIALVTDYWYGDPAALPNAITIVCAVASPLSVASLLLGLKGYGRAIAGPTADPIADRA